MSPVARHRALVAAARITCGAALIGCPAASTTAPEAMTPLATPVALGADALPGCRETTAAAFPDEASKDGKAVSADVLACCQRIAEDYDGKGMAGLGEWAERTGCCSALQWQGSGACTPWGPPTPPEMDA